LASVTEKLSNVGKHYADAVGVFFYQAKSTAQPTTYTKIPVGKARDRLTVGNPGVTRSAKSACSRLN
jgi:hypothetical protein